MKPLAGRTILVTRSREQAGALCGALEARGARVVEAPIIAFADPADWTPADAAIRRLESYDLLLFTSANAVERFARRVDHLGVPSTAWPRQGLVAIGAATGRALASRGFVTFEVAPAARAEGMMELLAERDLQGRKVLLPRAEVAREQLPEELRARGALVDAVTVYRTVAVPLAPDVRRLLEARGVDVVTFTSASTVTGLLAGLGGPATLRDVEIAVIGPVTAGAARESGLTPTIVAAGASMEDLAEAIAARYASR